MNVFNLLCSDWLTQPGRQYLLVDSALASNVTLRNKDILQILLKLNTVMFYTEKQLNTVVITAI